MDDFKLITPAELKVFRDTLAKSGQRVEDFRIDEEVYDPATAEVEAETGEVLVTCVRTHWVECYHIGRGSSWVADFADDLKGGKFEARARP
jgi:hypothetical protein